MKTLKIQKLPDRDYIELLHRYLLRDGCRLARSGFIERELKYIFRSPKLLKNFFKWMGGQTCGGDPTLGFIYYSSDVLRFIQMHRGIDPGFD